MKLVENISLEEINGKTYKIRLIESIDYGKASLTHYLHNSTNGVSKYYKKSAHQYLKHLLELKYPEIEITNAVAEEAMQYLLFDYKMENIPFPSPEQPKFKFIDLFAGIGGFRLASQNLGGNCVFSSEWDHKKRMKQILENLHLEI